MKNFFMKFINYFIAYFMTHFKITSFKFSFVCRAILFVSILFLLVLSSCVSSVGSGGGGLRLSILSNIPPSRIYDDQELRVAVEVENTGDFSIGNAGDKVYLSGFSPNIITGINRFGQEIPFLEEATSRSPGGKSLIEFKGAPRLLSTKNSYDVPLTVTACYGYQTVAPVTVCLDSDPHSISSNNKACTASSARVASQRSPVVVSSVLAEPSSATTRYTLSFSNTGGGDVFQPGIATISKCSPYADKSFDLQDLNVIRVDEIIVGNINIIGQCVGLFNGNYVRLSGGGNTITCKIDTSTAISPYVEIMRVKLSYNYRLQAFRQVSIYPSQ